MKITKIDPDSLNSPEALIQFSRISGNIELFGMPFAQEGFIQLTIATSKTHQERGYVRYMQDKELLEINLSYSQFAELLTCMNMGSGVPCTLTYFAGRKMPKVVLPDEKAPFRADALKSSKDALESLDMLRAEINDLKVAQKTKESLLAKVSKARRTMDDVLPFLADMFDERMEKVVQQAKTEIIAYSELVLKNFGLEALGKKILGLPESPEPTTLKQIEQDKSNHD